MRSWVPPPARVNVEDTAWRVEYGEVFRVRRLRDACVAGRALTVCSPCRVSSAKMAWRVGSARARTRELALAGFTTKT